MLDKRCRNSSHLGQLLKQKLSEEVDLKILTWVEENDKEDVVEEWHKAVAWMRQVNNQTGYQCDTFALSVHILDTFIGLMKIHGKYLKCAAASSIYIASKILEEKESVQALETFLQMNRSKFTASDIVRMERIILDKIGWELLARPTSATFLEIYFNLLCANHFEKVFGSDSLAYSIYRSLASQLEMTYCEPSLQHFPGSVKALSLLSCTLEKITSRWFLYIDPLARMSEISIQEILECRELVKTNLFGYVKPLKPKLHRPRKYSKRASQFALNNLKLSTITENPFETEFTKQQQEEVEEWIRRRLSKPKGIGNQSVESRRVPLKRLNTSGPRKLSMSQERSSSRKRSTPTPVEVVQTLNSSGRKRAAPSMEAIQMVKVRVQAPIQPQQDQIMEEEPMELTNQEETNAWMTFEKLR